MLIYLFGPDSYRRGVKLHEITDAFRTKHPGSNVERFSFRDEGEAERFSSFITSQSLFGGPKLAVMTDLEEAAKETAELIKSERETKGTTLVAISEKKLGIPFGFLSKEPVLIQRFDELDEKELEAFGKSEAKRRGINIASPRDFATLAKTFSGDTWSFITEIEKMGLGASHTERTATPAFFTLVQSLKSTDMGTRLAAVSRILEREEPAAAFNIAAALAGPGAKAKMADYDILVKSGKLEYEEALLDLALSS